MVDVGTSLAVSEAPEHDLLERVLESAGDAFAVMDASGIIVRINESMARRSSSQACELLGRHFLDVAPVELRSAYQSIWSDVTRTGQSVTWSSEFAGQVWEDSLRPVKSDHQASPWFLIYGRNITQQHETEVALRESELHVRTLAEVTDFGMAIVNDGHIAFLNPAMHQLLGTEESASTPDALVTHVNPQDRTTFLKMWRTDSEQTDRQTIRVRVESLGQERLIAMSARRMNSGQRSVVVWATDFSAQEQTNRQVMQAEKEESLVALAGGLAHDFNNILVSVLSGASLLQDELPPDPRMHELCAMITDGARRIADLTGKLLTYSRGAIFKPRPTDLNDVVRGAIQLTESSIGSHARVHAELDPNIIPVRGDASQLQQMVVTLLVNGAEAVQSEGGNIWVRTRLEASENGDRATVVLDIADDGEGMSPETQRRLFEPFYTTKFQGRGMGLAAAAGIIKAHGATVLVNSCQHQGSKFSVQFPVDLGLNCGCAQERDVASRPKRVLVVDDDDMVRRVVDRILRRAGYEVKLAGSGRDGVEAARDGNLGVMMVDIFMPGMNGDLVIEEVRRLNPHLPIVVCSGYGREQALAQIGEAAIQEFLMKPFVSDDLVATVERARGAELRPWARTSRTLDGAS
ncbi:MAG: response regulator [Myxococcota bacterium]